MRADGHEVVISDLYADDFNPVAGRHDFCGIDKGYVHLNRTPFANYSGPKQSWAICKGGIID
ncbi:hypothetical protein QBK99_02940 [Corticibacterium sp. UT-5YL-CI-8]|nr:hypothetical protein [Tianweitania sp. UT-5YL-CI-8]